MINYYKKHILVFMISILAVLGLILFFCQGKYIVAERRAASTLALSVYDLKYVGAPTYILQPHNPILQDLRLEIRREYANVLDIRIVDKDGKQFQIP